MKFKFSKEKRNYKGKNLRISDGRKTMEEQKYELGADDSHL
jgi:hypothetical protein